MSGSDARYDEEIRPPASPGGGDDVVVASSSCEGGGSAVVVVASSSRDGSNRPFPPPPKSTATTATTTTTTTTTTKTTTTTATTTTTTMTTTTTRRSPRLANPSADLSLDELYELPDVLTDDEASTLVRAIDGQIYGEVWRPEGYDRRHRVQRYPSFSSSSEEEDKEEEEKDKEGEKDKKEKEGNGDGRIIRRASSSAMEDAFGWIFDRIVSRSSSSSSSSSSPSPSSSSSTTSPPLRHRPYEVVVVEHTPSSCRSTVMTFERNAPCRCRCGGGGGDYLDDENDVPPASSCDCYVARLTLLNDAIRSIERPACRDPECWDLAFPHGRHATEYVASKNGVIVESGDCLWDWRGRTSGMTIDDDVDGGGGGALDPMATATAAGGIPADEDVGATTATATTTTITTTRARARGRGGGKPWTRTAKINASGRRCISIVFLGMRPPPSRAAEEDVDAFSSPPSGRPNVVVDDASEEGGAQLRTTTLLPPLSALLTVVITTSPIRSHPSTELLERTFNTFPFAGDEFAYECRKVIVCDGCRVLEGDVDQDDSREEKKDDTTAVATTTMMGGRRHRITQKYANTKQTLRNGIATVEQAKNYDEFKTRLRKLCDAANVDDDYNDYNDYSDDNDDNDEDENNDDNNKDYDDDDDDNDNDNNDDKNDEPPRSTERTTARRSRRRRRSRSRRSPFCNASVVELDKRHGYGFALRHALRHHVRTPYVCVIQHDRTFMRPAPVQEVVAAMANDPRRRIKYVGMSMRSNLMYHDIFSGKFGRRAAEEFKTLILRPTELCVGGGVYGPDGTSVGDMVTPSSEKRQILLDELRKTYRGSHQCITQDEWLQSQRERESTERERRWEGDGYHQLTLTPVLFWYDNTHIAETAHYRNFVFHPQYKMVARGGFVEDKLSPCLVRSCERLGLTEGHAKFGCYLLDDHSGVVFTGHLDGGSFMTADLHVNISGEDVSTIPR